MLTQTAHIVKYSIAIKAERLVVILCLLYETTKHKHKTRFILVIVYWVLMQIMMKIGFPVALV